MTEKATEWLYEFDCIGTPNMMQTLMDALEAAGFKYESGFAGPVAGAMRRDAENADLHDRLTDAERQLKAADRLADVATLFRIHSDHWFARDKMHKAVVAYRALRQPEEEKP